MNRIRVLLSATLVVLTAVIARAQPSESQSGGATMHAIVVHEMGVPGVMKFESVPKPTPGDDDLLIRVRAAGVNPVDYKIRSGGRSQWAKPPFTPGYDASGIVEAVGKNIKKFKAGDEVYAYIALQRGGAFAEYLLTKEGETALKPATLTHTQAAGVPLAALTAWQALIDNGKLAKGERVLIHGGAGGVGHFAIQIAKAKGAYVIATGSAESQKVMKDLGADETIDYKAVKFEDSVKDVDLVLDSIGGDTQDRSWKVIKKGGRLVSILQPPDQAKATAAGATGMVMLVRPNADQLAEIGKLIDDGQIKVTVSRTFPLAEAEKAYEQIATGHTKGKIVLEIDGAGNK